MSRPLPTGVSLEDAPHRSVPALVADDEAIWVCLRCSSVCCSGHATLYVCARCGARYALHVWR